MNSIEGETKGKLYYLHLKKDEDVLLEIRRFIKEKNIKNGVVVSGIGTLSSCSWHGVVTADFPAKDEFYVVDEEPMELTGLSGVIAEGEPHLHMCVMSYGRSGQMICGHIEPGCKVLCLAEISIMETNDILMCRRIDEDGINQLQEA